MSINAALVAIFGAEADDITVSHIDNLTPCLTPKQAEGLMRAVGGPWLGVLARIEQKRAQMKGAKDPGADARLVGT